MMVSATESTQEGPCSQLDADGFKNADLAISTSQVLENIQKIQRSQNLPISDNLITSAKCDFNLISRWRQERVRPIAISKRSLR